MKKYFIFLILASLVLMWSACEEWTNTVDPLIDRVEDERLTTEDAMSFLMTGIYARFADCVDNLYVCADLLSDQMIFDGRVPNATYPTFQQLETGKVRLDNNSVDTPLYDLGELRFFSDDILRRATEITFADAALEQQVTYVGNLYGGFARFLYAAYFGLNETQGGATIDAGPFLPSADLYAEAVTKLELALAAAASETEVRIVNSLIARVYLFQNNWAKAKEYADKGMVEGDAAFATQYNSEADNYFRQQAGYGRTQAVMDFRFVDYINEDPNELARIPLDSVLASDESQFFYFQAKYPDRSTPLPIMTWQENNLMLAECALNGQSGDAAALVNAVRVSHGLAELTTVDVAALKIERDKELMCQGARLVDQRRWDDWHLGSGTWQYLPITERERNANDNLDDV